MVSLRSNSSDAGLSGFAMSTTLTKLSETLMSISFQSCDLYGMLSFPLTSADVGFAHSSGLLITWASFQSCDFLAVLMKSIADAGLIPVRGDGWVKGEGDDKP